MDDFFLRALLGGLGVALVAGPLGSFVVWRRMAFVGDTMSHSALLGIAVGVALHIHVAIGVLVAAVAVALLLGLSQRQRRLPTDTFLGILAHASLAIGLIVMALLDLRGFALMNYLFGDILAVSRVRSLLDLRRCGLGAWSAGGNLAAFALAHGARRAGPRRRRARQARAHPVHAPDRDRHRGRARDRRRPADYLDADHSRGGRAALCPHARADGRACGACRCRRRARAGYTARSPGIPPPAPPSLPRRRRCSRWQACGQTAVGPAVAGSADPDSKTRLAFVAISPARKRGPPQGRGWLKPRPAPIKCGARLKCRLNAGLIG